VNSCLLSYVASYAVGSNTCQHLPGPISPIPPGTMPPDPIPTAKAQYINQALGGGGVGGGGGDISIIEASPGGGRADSFPKLRLLPGADLDACERDLAGGVLSIVNKHPIDVEWTPPPPRVYMSIHPEGKSCPISV